MQFSAHADRRGRAAVGRAGGARRASVRSARWRSFAVVFTGIACSAVALPLQLWGQQRIPATRAALILLSEPVFAGIAGYVNGERLGAGRARRRGRDPGGHRGLGVLAAPAGAAAPSPARDSAARRERT